MGKFEPDEEVESRPKRRRTFNIIESDEEEEMEDNADDIRNGSSVGGLSSEVCLDSPFLNKGTFCVSFYMLI